MSAASRSGAGTRDQPLGLADLAAFEQHLSEERRRGRRVGRVRGTRCQSNGCEVFLGGEKLAGIREGCDLVEREHRRAAEEVTVSAADATSPRRRGADALASAQPAIVSGRRE